MITTLNILKAFVLQLENDKWFVHISTLHNKDANLDYIKYESTCLFDFVNKNPPIKIYEIINITNKYEINNIVKTYMEYFGIDNVRGGIYSDEILPNYLIQSLELEMKSPLENYEKKVAIFDSLHKKENVTINDFQHRQNEYINLLNTGYLDITRDFFTELEWLRNIVDSFTPSCVENAQMATLPSIIYANDVGILNEKRHVTGEKQKRVLNNNDRYLSLLNKFTMVREKYFQLDETIKHIDMSPFLRYPNFIFDFFMYHKSWKNRNWEEGKKNALELINHYELMGYTIINIIDCQEFDFYNPILITC